MITYTHGNARVTTTLFNEDQEFLITAVGRDASYEETRHALGKIFAEADDEGMEVVAYPSEHELTELEDIQLRTLLLDLGFEPETGARFVRNIGEEW